MIRDLERGDLTIAVIGGGTMGRGIAQVCAQAGMTTLLFDSRDGAAREAVSAVDKALDSLVAKGRVPPASGTLPTHGPLFVCVLIGTVMIVGGLTFFPALALGPIAEHYAMLHGALYAGP